MGALQSFANQTYQRDTAIRALSPASLSVVSVISFLAIMYMVHRMFYQRQKSVEVRATLTEQQAAAIYRKKISFMQSVSNQSASTRAKRIRQECAAIGAQYRVSSKAVHDVWNRKTWVSATSHLWHSEQI